MPRTKFETISMPRRVFVLYSLFVALSLSARLLLMSCEAQDEDRVASARVRSETAVRERFAKAGVPYPAEELFFRAFKREAALEVWARGAQGPLRLIHTYPWTVNSGGPGPKRRQGDLQIPEGFYMIEAFNPKSRFHLSLRVNYPNASDRVRSDREKPGLDIYIHGNVLSVGCLALGDVAIEEVYLAALDAQNRAAIAAHIFPARMQGIEWEKLRRTHPEHAPFWDELQPGFDAFEKTKRVPRVAVTDDGRYVLD